MIDTGVLRNDLEELRASLKRRGLDVDLDALADLDVRRRQVRARSEEIRAEQRDFSKQIATLQGDEKQSAIEKASGMSAAYKESLAEADALDDEFEATWVTLPNMTDPTAADGLSDEDNVELRTWGKLPDLSDPRDHVELGELHGTIDVERGAKVSGSRFGYLLGSFVKLELAMVTWAMGILEGHGFVPVIPPVLVKEDALFGTGFFPADREQVYSLPYDDLFLVGTSEVSLAAFHGDEILDEDALPIRYAGFSPCFRREAGTYGKDTRGMFRVHQFDKLEMFSFVHPDRSGEEHDFLLAREEELVQALGIPYRVVNVAAGDLGASAAKKYDIEAWFAGQGRYREITSTSNTTDYQSRRLKIRFRGEAGNQLVHTLNGTAVAGRLLIALVEHYQQEDGTIDIPEVLRPFTGFDVIAAP
jgi:seryl-tRNA synthetase